MCVCMCMLSHVTCLFNYFGAHSPQIAELYPALSVCVSLQKTETTSHKKLMQLGVNMYHD